MYRTLPEGVWLSDIGRMAEVRNDLIRLYSHLASKVRYISFQRNLQLKIHLSSYHLVECCEVLTRFGFRRKMLYLCTSKEERALNKRVLSSFFGPKNGIFTSEIDFYTLLRIFFLVVCGIFSVM